MKKYIFLSLFALSGCSLTINTVYEKPLTEREKIAKMAGVTIINDSTINVSGKRNIENFQTFCGCLPHADREGFAGFKYKIK